MSQYVRLGRCGACMSLLRPGPGLGASCATSRVLSGPLDRESHFFCSFPIQFFSRLRFDSVICVTPSSCLISDVRSLPKKHNEPQNDPKRASSGFMRVAEWSQAERESKRCPQTP